MSIRIAGSIEHAKKAAGDQRIAGGSAFHIAFHDHFLAGGQFTPGDGGFFIGFAGLIVDVFAIRAPALPKAGVPEMAVQLHMAKQVQQIAILIHDGYLTGIGFQIRSTHKHPAGAVRRFGAHSIVGEQTPMIFYLENFHIFQTSACRLAKGENQISSGSLGKVTLAAREKRSIFSLAASSMRP